MRSSRAKVINPLGGIGNTVVVEFIRPNKPTKVVLRDAVGEDCNEKGSENK
jgi:hypothetical protein